MHIKRITIQGFKTYKNSTVIDLLSPHHNVVVGRNGSGKSNFFAAIRFVLSDAYTHMTREERQGLIHEGSGTVMSAFVEIVFDNEDGRFPIAKDEISIRRTIGLKKDDYSMDGRSATRSDIMNLLESAGFSRSNPYYIVPQGRITHLTNSKDTERFTLLKEVSGATVFENKLKELMKEMNNSQYKLQRIDETMSMIDERLSDLQIESHDLKNYQQLERRKKVLHYKLLDREFTNLNDTIEDLDDKYSEMLSDLQAQLKDLDSRETLCQELADAISGLKVSLKIARLEKEQNDVEYTQLLKALSDKQIKLNESKSTLMHNTEKSTEITAAISHLEEQIRRNEHKIHEIRPNLERLRDQETHLKSDLARLTMEQRALYSKQSRFQKFANKAERDQWLSTEIYNLKNSIKAKDSEIGQASLKVKSEQLTLEEITKNIATLELEIGDGDSKQTQALRASIENLKSKMTELMDRRKALWRVEIKHKSVYDSLKNELATATNSVNQTVDRAQLRGLESVKAIARKLNLTHKVYGPIIDLINVSDKYKVAAEVIAGNSLFHVVVDTDQTASLIMQELVRTKGGRVTFVPLNRIKQQTVEYPDSQAHQVIPLMKKIKYTDEKVGPAISQIFGKVIVCHDLQAGTELAKQFKLSAITLDGDRLDLKGVITGGYRDFKKSKIDLIKFQSKKAKELEQVENDLRSHTLSIEQVSQEITSVNSELQLNMRDLDRMHLEQEPKKIALSKQINQKFNVEQDLNTHESALESLSSVKSNLMATLKQYEKELNSVFTNALNEEEQRLLEQLKGSISQTEGQLDDVVTKLAEFETEISGYESELSSNYQPQLAKLLLERTSMTSSTDSGYDVDVSQLEREVEAFNIELDSMQSKRQAASDEYNKISLEISKSEDTLKKVNEQQMTVMKKLDKFAKHTEKTLNKKAIMTNRREEINQKIRELGVLPEEAFQSSGHDDQGSEALLKDLNLVDEELLKYSHINKRAIEQYTTFTKQRDDLSQRREELTQSHKSIEDLITSLKLQKNDAITKSFHQVAESFADVFSKLVPMGQGQLIMQKKDSADDGDEFENYAGVGISVSFNSKHDDQQRIEQLSGGQKSLCAIALILAIQKCDPAPFYLFDEIDANLDTQYRTAVASLINTLSKGAQFICTTFRPEMIQVADTFYGVMFDNKVSTVSEITREQALTFVEGQQHV